MDIKHLTSEELKTLQESILIRNAFWQSSRDGSYEMALHYAGYDDVLKEIALREQNE